MVALVIDNNISNVILLNEGLELCGSAVLMYSRRWNALSFRDFKFFSWSHFSERRGREVNTHLYSGGPVFKSTPGDWYPLGKCQDGILN
jgi:hypothetical protein